jgi:hypothetical protein
MSIVRAVLAILEFIASLVKEGRAKKGDQDTTAELGELAKELEAKDDARTQQELRDILGG